MYMKVLSKGPFSLYVMWEAGKGDIYVYKRVYICIQSSFRIYICRVETRFSRILLLSEGLYTYIKPL